MIIKFLLLALLSVTNSQPLLTKHSNGCITFSVAQGTGCQWMCDYCSSELETYNYYFTDNVCTYETGGCVGNPIAGKQYTCCDAGKDEL